MKVSKYIQVIIILFAFMTICCVQVNCPQGCECSEQDSVYSKEMVCMGRDSIPPHSNTKEFYSLNISKNSLIVVRGDSFATSTQLKLLDLSYNRIADIDNGAFGKERLPHLLSLNISDNFLTTFPKNLTPSLQHLRLTSNNIKKLHILELCHQENLRVLYLDNNEIMEIVVEDENQNVAKHCSKGVNRLEILSLSNNRLRSIDRSLWKYMSQLQYLSLANNVITTVKADSFKVLRMVKYLDLSENRIHTVAPKAFYHFNDLQYLSLSDNVLEHFLEDLPMVEWLDISNNTIKEIPEGKKSSLYPHEVFLIGRNPLHCDCTMLWVKEFYDTREYQLKFIDVDSEKFIPVCETPDHLRGDTWDVLANAAFGCNENVQDQTVEEEEKLVWKLRDLSVKIVAVGDTFIKVDWDCVNIGVQTNEKHTIIFYIHPFGKKHQRKSVSVHPQIGRYVLKALRPSTAYVVCMTVVAGSPVATVTSDDCLEIITKETIVVQESWIFYLLRNPTFYLIILTLSVCFWYTRSA